MNKLSLRSFTGGQHLREGGVEAGFQVRVGDHQHRLFVLGMQNDALLTASIQLNNQISVSLNCIDLATHHTTDT